MALQSVNNCVMPESTSRVLDVQAQRMVQFTCAPSTCLTAMWTPTLATPALCTAWSGARATATISHQPPLMALPVSGEYTR